MLRPSLTILQTTPLIAIRTLNPKNNFQGLITLSCQFFQEYQTHHPHFLDLDELQDEHVIACFSSFCHGENRAAFLALDQGQIVGYITVYVKEQPAYWQIKRIGEISGLMVRKDYRREISPSVRSTFSIRRYSCPDILSSA